MPCNNCRFWVKDENKFEPPGFFMGECQHHQESYFDEDEDKEVFFYGLTAESNDCVFFEELED